ncbi:hypothetical protein ABPG77_004649 [Micractinium sp. CCAP 211/92]
MNKWGHLLLCSLALLNYAAAADPPCSYIVQPGDSLFDIGSKFELTSSDVADANPQVDNIELIQPGQVLYLPCGGNATEGTSILDWLANRDDMHILFQAVLSAGFADMFNDTKAKGTLFAPGDEAWFQVLDRLNLTAADLLADKELLSTILKYHYAPEVDLKAEDLENGENITTALTGEDLVVYKPRAILRIATNTGKKVRVVEMDIPAGAALVHTVKNVLWPANNLLELPPPSGNCVHVVKAGDTLFQVAKDAGTTVASLIDLNPDLEANGGASLQPGMELILFPSCSA